MFNLLNKISNNQSADHYVNTFIILAYLVSISLVVRVLSVANTGIDLTDEGYYLNWISNPWLYKYYVTQFGYVYHPIYKLLGNSVTHLRQFNILFSFLLAWILSGLVLNQQLKISFFKSFLLGASLALPSLFILSITGFWLPTPSYNSLNFQGCLLASLGIVLSLNQNDIKKILAGALIGLGGLLVFLAKPSTALILAIVIIVFYIPSLKTDWRILFTAALVSIAGLLLSAMIIDGSIYQFINRYEGGLSLRKILKAESSISQLFRLDSFKVSNYFLLKFLIIFSLATIAQTLHLYTSKFINNVVVLVMILIMVVVSFRIINPYFSGHIAVTKYHFLILATITLASILYAAFSYRVLSRLNFRLSLFFLMLPYIYSVGTGNNYWMTGSGACVFWGLAAVLLYCNNYSLVLKQLIVPTAVIAFVSSGAILDSMSKPYRQSESIFEQSSVFVNSHSNEKLKLASDSARYLNSLSDEMASSGFKEGTPVIDLSGHHPGALYFLKAKSIGQAWHIGGYNKSNSLAGVTLNQASCEDIASAWLLIEKDGRRSLSDSILKSQGLDVNRQTYSMKRQVLTRVLPRWGGFNAKYPDSIYKHYIFKPTQYEKQKFRCKYYRSAQVKQIIPYQDAR